MTQIRMLGWLITGLVICIACNNDAKDTNLHSETDTDQSTDMTTDTDSNDDEDTAKDGGMDTGADGDADTESEKDGDTSGDGGVDSGTDLDTDVDSESATHTDTTSPCIDNDSDDWCSNFDCNDNSPEVNPDADEIFDPPNSIDEDCDALTDEANSTGLEDWDMYLTVDNMFDVYFGTPNQTTGTRVGGGSAWTQEFHFTAEDRSVTDYMYVATASDHSGAQGFLGTFTNLTRGKTTITGDPVWEVFPAGAHKETNPYWPDPWPARLMPTQAEVNTAIAHAEENQLWVIPVSAPGYDNDPSTPIAPATSEWRTQCNPVCTYDHIPTNAQWIWFDSGRGPTTSWAAPIAGFNHDEFLVFRVAGAVPAVN